MLLDDIAWFDSRRDSVYLLATELNWLVVLGLSRAVVESRKLVIIQSLGCYLRSLCHLFALVHVN